jgi:two-component system, LytTR family, response regulator
MSIKPTPKPNPPFYSKKRVMTPTIRALIVDDESRARTLLRGLLTEYCPQVEIVGEAADLPSGVKAIRKHKPNLVFLDIEMPGYSGLELLEFFDENEVDFCIIFTTAYDQYALRAFKLSAIDYLLKPLDPTELENAVQRVCVRQQDTLSNAVRYETMQNISPQRIAVPSATGVKFIDLAQVLYFKADNSYTEIMTATQERIIVSRTLKNFEEALEGHPDFIRIHKSFVINMSHVTDYLKTAGGFAIIANKHEIPISPDKLQEFLERSIAVKR